MFFFVPLSLAAYRTNASWSQASSRKEKGHQYMILEVSGPDRPTATAIARLWIPALASTTFELMKPPYDWAINQPSRSSVKE